MFFGLLEEKTRFCILRTFGKSASIKTTTYRMEPKFKAAIPACSHRSQDPDLVGLAKLGVHEFPVRVFSSIGVANSPT